MASGGSPSYGTSSADALVALGLTVERVPRRGRYFAFRGSPREKKKLRAAIADRVQPYPKRHNNYSSSGVVAHNRATLATYIRIVPCQASSAILQKTLVGFTERPK
jgi:hypothetical protein